MTQADEFAAAKEDRRRWWGLDQSKKRAELREALRALGITQLDAEYDGYGDEGNVHDWTLTPDKTDDATRAATGLLTEKISDFIWEIPYSQHSGFENNDGAFGSVSWNLETDKIHLTHHCRFTDYDTTETEGL